MQLSRCVQSPWTSCLLLDYIRVILDTLLNVRSGSEAAIHYKPHLNTISRKDDSSN